LAAVAKAAKVSPSTVSRALSGHAKISTATRERVRQVADRLGYSPDRRLGRFFREVHRGTRTIAVLMHQKVHREAAAGSPFYSRISWSLQNELQQREYYMLLASADGDETVDGGLRSVAEGVVEGVIAEVKDDSLITRLQGRVPVVLFNVECRMGAVDTVLPNVEKAAGQQVEHLVALGHRRIACFHPRPADLSPPTQWQNRRFWRGYRDACDARGLVCPDRYLAPIEFGPGQDEVAVAGFLDRVLTGNDAPTAVLTHDGYAGELICQLERRGLRVPRDISLVGYDDFDFDRPCPIPLTTYRQDFESMARVAVDLLLQRLKEPGRVPMLVQVPGQLIVRDSTAPPPEAG
jgi:DNA-binding LacI/PurR family transcriptional regulator